MTFVRPAGSAPHPPWARRFGIPSSPAVEGSSENQERLLDNMNLRNINLDRRQNFRKTPDKFAFLQLERDDGGSVQDVSEGGLRFETFAPVTQSGPVHLWFSLNLRERIEAWGEVVWTDAAKKGGGLRFLRLSEENRAQIREWISRPTPQVACDEEFLSRGGLTEIPVRIGTSETDAVARFVSKARPRVTMKLIGTEEDGEASTLFPEPLEVEASGELVPMQRYLSAMRRQLILGLFLGTCISAIVAVAAIKYSNYRHENKSLGKAPAELSTQESSGNPLPTVGVNSSAASGTSADIFGSNNQKQRVAEAHKPTILATETGGHPSRQAWEVPASSPAARAALQPSLSGNTSRQISAMTPQQLWASVQAGNTKAAVTLAELYIKGEGVPQNCNQARVLLLVASEKRNAAAIKRLQELDKTGCPLE